MLVFGAGPGITHASASASSNEQEVSLQNDRARELFSLGVNAFRAGRHEEARQLLSEALRLRRTYDVAAMLAQVENELGHHARAAELLDFCLNNFAPIESDSKLQYLRGVFDQVKRKVGILDPSELPVATEIRVDGELLGNATSTTPMYLEPGQHDLDLRVGSRRTHRLLEVKAGQVQRLRFDAGSDDPEDTKALSAGVSPRDPAVGSSGQKQAHTPPNSKGSSATSRPQLPYYIGGGLLVAGVSTAVAYQLAANAASQPQDRVFNQNLAIFGYGVAATAVLATTIYWLWPESNAATQSAQPTAATLAVAVDRTHLWMGATTCFP